MKMNKKIRIGSRDSILAIRQANIVIEAIRTHDSGIELELLTFKTTGDKILDTSLDYYGGKGLFIKELETALANGQIDIAVHSYKDMPYEETDGLPIVALSKRDSPYDALVLPEGVAELDRSKPVGSSSLRRTIQFNRLYENVKVAPIRGNVPTRLKKLDSGEYSALILAEAGLNRLSLQHRVNRVFTVDEMIPSGSQGILAVQGRIGEEHSYLNGFHDRESEIVSKAERQFLRTLDAGCSAPVAVFGQLSGNEILLSGMCADDSGMIKTGELTGSISEAELLGEKLALQLTAQNAPQVEN